MTMQVRPFAAHILAVWLCASPVAAQEATSSDPVDTSPLFVRTIVVDQPDTAQERHFFGRIAALETADLSFEVPGYLALLDAPRGSFVARGDAIAGLDLAPFERAVERAELALAQAERDLERLTRLASRNVTSEVQTQDAETARDLADVALRNAREALADAQLAAPFDGIIADRMVATFTNVSAGQPIVRIHNMSEVRVEFDLPERILTAVGDPAQVSFSTILPGQTDPVPLVFREIEAQTGAVGQSYTISLAIEGEVSGLVLPGKTVTVTARLKRQDNAISVPATAIVTRPDGAPVVVALEGEESPFMPAFVPVEVQSSTGVDLVVTGVEPGTEIVALGGHMIGSDTKLARYSGLIIEDN